VPNNRRQLTPDELRLIADEKFFADKARIMKKIRNVLEELHAGLKEDMAGVELLAPPGFEPNKFQLVKGEHLQEYPYQYLDYPKHFEGDEKLTYRSLFWWGHHFAFALILEGKELGYYKRNLINRYHQVAGRDLFLSLAPTLWEWRRGEGYTLPITHDRKSPVSAVLSGRPFCKLVRFLPFEDSAVSEGRIIEIGRQTFRSLLPVITP
jgi:hypothetical protein